MGDGELSGRSPGGDSFHAFIELVPVADSTTSLRIDDDDFGVSIDHVVDLGPGG